MGLLNKWKRHFKVGLLLSMLVLVVGATAVYAAGGGSHATTYDTLVVKHIWKDYSNRYGTRPESIETTLATKDYAQYEYIYEKLGRVVAEPKKNHNDGAYYSVSEDWRYPCLSIHYIDTEGRELRCDKTITPDNIETMGRHQYYPSSSIQYCFDGFEHPEGAPIIKVPLHGQITGYHIASKEKAEEVLSNMGQTLVYDIHEVDETGTDYVGNGTPIAYYSKGQWEAGSIYIKEDTDIYVVYEKNTAEQTVPITIPIVYQLYNTATYSSSGKIYTSDFIRELPDTTLEFNCGDYADEQYFVEQGLLTKDAETGWSVYKYNEKTYVFESIYNLAHIDYGSQAISPCITGGTAASIVKEHDQTSSTSGDIRINCYEIESYKAALAQAEAYIPADPDANVPEVDYGQGSASSGVKNTWNFTTNIFNIPGNCAMIGTFNQYGSSVSVDGYTTTSTSDTTTSDYGSVYTFTFTHTLNNTPDTPEFETYSVIYEDGVDDETIFDSADQTYPDLPGDGTVKTPSFRRYNGEDTPVRENYVFLGWQLTSVENPSEDLLSSAAVAEKDVVIADANDQNQIIYTAHWREKGQETYTVVYQDSATESPFATKTIAEVDGTPLALDDMTPAFGDLPTRADSTFQGWKLVSGTNSGEVRTDDVVKAIQISKDDANRSGDDYTIIYEAVWKPIPAASYKVIHQYYINDVLVDTHEHPEIPGTAGTEVLAESIDRETLHDGKDYTFTSITPDDQLVLEEGTVKEFILRYDRTEATTGTYTVRHMYYRNGSSLEGDITKSYTGTVGETILYRASMQEPTYGSRTYTYQAGRSTTTSFELTADDARGTGQGFTLVYNRTTGGGGGGGGTPDPKPDPDPVIPTPNPDPDPVIPDPQPEPQPEPEPTPTPEPEPTPTPEPEPEPPTPTLPDPNDPDSPDEVTIMEDGVPKTYKKVWDPEKEEYVYIPEEDVPLADRTPKTGDSSRTALWAVLTAASLAGAAAITVMEKRRKNR